MREELHWRNVFQSQQQIQFPSVPESEHSQSSGGGVDVEVQLRSYVS